MKRWIFKLVVFLLLGAVATTLVAWSLSAYQPLAMDWAWADPVETTQEPLWQFGTYSRRGGMQLGSQVVMNRRRTSKPLQQAPHWSRASVAPTREDFEARLHVLETAHGWPKLSHFHRKTTQRGDWRGNVEWRVQVPWFPRNGRKTTRALPLAPIWPGFAINTIFYATILWLPFAPFQLRRYVRVKRGCCINCGYDLRGDFSAGCPECGWRRENVP